MKKMSSEVEKEYLKKVVPKLPEAEIREDLKSIETELEGVTKLKTKKARVEWAKNNPEKYKKIWDVYMKYAVEVCIEALKELQELFEERLGNEKRMYEAIIRKNIILEMEK